MRTNLLCGEYPVDTLIKSVLVVEKTLSDTQAGYDVIPWKEFETNWEQRALGFCDLEILSLGNTLQDSGRPVYRHVRYGFCRTRTRTKRYKPKIGNDTLNRHVELQKIRKNSYTDPFNSDLKRSEKENH